MMSRGELGGGRPGAKQNIHVAPGDLTDHMASGVAVTRAARVSGYSSMRES